MFTPDPNNPRRAEGGKLLTFTVLGIESGEPMLCDDRTFDPAHHVLPDAEAANEAESAPKTGKRKKAE